MCSNFSVKFLLNFHNNKCAGCILFCFVLSKKKKNLFHLLCFIDAINYKVLGKPAG